MVLSVLLIVAATTAQAAPEPAPEPAPPVTTVSQEQLDKHQMTTVADAIRIVARGVSVEDQLKRRPHAPIGNPGQYFTQENYPPAAIRAGEQGRVVARLTIGTDGKVTDCVTVSTSGSYALDDATCQIALRKVTYYPAVDEHGKPIVATTTLPVRWTLPEPSPPPLPSTPLNISVNVQLTIGTDGRVETCESEPALPSGLPDPCLQTPVGRQVMAPPKRDGRPVKAHMSVNTDIVTVLDP